MVTFYLLPDSMWVRMATSHLILFAVGPRHGGLTRQLCAWWATRQTTDKVIHAHTLPSIPVLLSSAWPRKPWQCTQQLPTPSTAICDQGQRVRGRRGGRRVFPYVQTLPSHLHVPLCSQLVSSSPPRRSTGPPRPTRRLQVVCRWPAWAIQRAARW